MKFIKIVAVVLVIGFIFSGCNMVEVNPERDMETVVAKVGEEVVTKGEVYQIVNGQINFYTMYGYYPENFATDPEFEEEYKQLVSTVLDSLIDSKIEKIMAKEKGCYEFTAEERAKLDEEISSSLYMYAQGYAEVLRGLPENADLAEDVLLAKALEDIDTYFKQNDFGITKQEIIEEAEDAKAVEILHSLTTSSIAVTEDEVKTSYDVLVKSDKDAYEQGLQSYESDMSNGEAIYYTPEGARMVQHILIGVPEDMRTGIDALRAAGSEDAANAKLDEAMMGIEEAANAAYERAIAGEDFKLLMEELGEDPGMNASEYYVVLNPSMNYVAEFSDALFALENVGDISKPVASNFGYHIIKYYGDMESGPVPYDDIHDNLYDGILTEKQDIYYNEQFALWKEGININKYERRMFS